MDTVRESYKNIKFILQTCIELYKEKRTLSAFYVRASCVGVRVICGPCVNDLVICIRQAESCTDLHIALSCSPACVTVCDRCCLSIVIDDEAPAGRD